MLAKLATFTADLLSHNEYRTLIFVLHDGGASGIRAHFVRSRMFYGRDNSVPTEMDSSTVSTSPVRKILCGIARILEANSNGDNWWEDPRVTVCAFTSAEAAKDALGGADYSGHRVFWPYEIVKPTNS